MEWYWWVLVIYVAIGAMKALNHLGTGRCGAKGPGATFVAITLFWPLI